ncbi:hypothetical protein EVAR_64120_1 [Eumeta japonica]|uniref:Uncharacterized protein n=1 Tax=Eumeta variegata TaxID=151549 RepID=A0A4C1ZB89_EUMVA|nr:hypothetical protein EVAR_64120_1 [Eumeta japonica]
MKYDEHPMDMRLDKAVCTVFTLLGAGFPLARGMGKEEKNPLWAVHAPGHTGVSDSHRTKNLLNNSWL